MQNISKNLAVSAGIDEHWSVKGANAIIALRCSKLSGRGEDSWERRSERKHVTA